MKIRVDSIEYKCWHEVGHATVGLHLGGDIDFIELLDGDARGHARDISRIVFHNATSDREDFWGRKLGSDEAFTEAEDTGFMNHAIGSDGHGGMVPIFNKYFSVMREIVRELCEARRVEGSRVKELLRPGIPR